MAKDVALFITCLTDQFYPQVGLAVTRILEHFGCRVHFPEQQTCCGQPFFNNGFHDQARDLAKRMIELFEPYPYIVTPSASCCAMVRCHFPQLFAGDHAWESGCHRLATRTFEFVEFLDQVLKVDFGRLKLPQPQTVTYHYNCHLRLLGIRDQAERVLKQIGNVRFCPLERAEQCCGFGGAFAVKYPAISTAIVEDKIKCLTATEASLTVCNDAGCTLNISGMGHRHGLNTRLCHIAELIAEALGIDLARW